MNQMAMNASKKFKFDTSDFTPHENNSAAEFSMHDFEPHNVADQKPADRTYDTFLGQLSPEAISLQRPTRAQERYLQQQHVERAKGALQSLANYPIGLINMLHPQGIGVPQPPINKLAFAPNTQAGKEGELIGDIGSYFLPGGAAKVGLRGIAAIPKLGAPVKGLMNQVGSTRWLKNILGIGEAGASTALFNAEHHPEDRTKAGLEGLGLGSGMQAAMNLATTTNPLINAAARAGIGFGIGYPMGHGNLGAGIGVGLPAVGKVLGLTSKRGIHDEMLEGLQPKDISRAKIANDRLGTNITPAQASGNYVTAAKEGNLKRTPQGGQEAYRQEVAQTRQQSNAINKMLDSIYKPTKKSENAIQELYGKSYKVNLEDNLLNEIKKNPLWRSALSEAKRDPSLLANLQREGGVNAFKSRYKDIDHVNNVIDKRINNLFNTGKVEQAEHMMNNRDALADTMLKQKTVNENNYKFLNEAKTKLDDMYQKAVNNGNLSQARRINIEREAYLKKLDDFNDTYKQARAAAAPKMAREEIESKLNKNAEDYTGKNFYSKFLNARKPYQDILRNTKNYPEAQQAIKDMRQGWKHLSNIKTVSQGEAQSKTGLSQARDQLMAMWEAMKKISGAKQDVQGLKYIYSKDWDKDFTRIMSKQSRADRNRELATLLGKMGVAAHLEPNKD